MTRTLKLVARFALFGALLCSIPASAQQPVQALGSGVQNSSDAAWTSATGGNTAVQFIAGSSKYNAVFVTLVQGTTITGGVVTFEQSIDNSTFTTVQGVTLGTTAIMGPTYTLTASTNISFLFPVNAPYFQIRLSTAITGSGTVTVQHSTQSLPAAALLAGTETLAAGTNIIGALVANQSVNTAQVGGTAIDTNSGTKSGGTQRVVIATDQPQLTNKLLVTPDANVKVNIVGNAGASVDGAINGAAPTNVVWHTPAPSTAAGAAVSTKSLSTTTGTTGTNVKASAGNLYGIFAINGAASTCWVQFMNSGSTGTLGTASIVSFPLPASTTQPIWIPLPYPINFTTGIAVGTSTTNNGAVACGTATALVVQYE